jgi:hypothetical protein
VVIDNLKHRKVDLDRVLLIEGWYQDTCTEQTRERHALKKARVVHIDSDLYESAVDALAFITPMVQTGTIVIFDEYYHFRGDPRKGEACAFAEWLEANPHIIATEYMKEFPWRNSFLLTHTSE